MSYQIIRGIMQRISDESVKYIRGSMFSDEEIEIAQHAGLMLAWREDPETGEMWFRRNDGTDFEAELSQDFPDETPTEIHGVLTTEIILASTEDPDDSEVIFYTSEDE